MMIKNFLLGFCVIFTIFIFVLIGLSYIFPESFEDAEEMVGEQTQEVTSKDVQEVVNEEIVSVKNPTGYFGSDNELMFENVLEHNCDYEKLANIAASVADSVFKDYPDWKLEREVKRATTTDEYAWSGRDYQYRFLPCDYEVVYKYRYEGNGLEQTSDIVRALEEGLFGMGWKYGMSIDLISDSTGNRFPLEMSPGDGPMGGSVPYMFTLYEERSVQFARIWNRQQSVPVEHTVDNPMGRACPCSGEIGLSISAPVSLARFLD